MTTPLWTSDDAAEATGGTASLPFAVDNVVIDSRQISNGDLFIAIRGENQDGHKYIAAAIQAGASAAMIADDWTGDIPDDFPVLRVKDTMDGLCDLARAARNRSQARIVGVTGSVGKTSTKEGLYRALSLFGKTHATKGNLNNHYGLPLTLARMPSDCRFGVFEIGMNHAGEIEPLSIMLRPHIAVITTVAAVHLEFFSSILGIADAKAEIFAGLDEDGTAVLNRNNPLFHHLRAHAEDRGIRNISSFGTHPDSTFQLLSATPNDDGGSQIICSHSGQTITYVLGAPGDHWALNSVAILTTVSAMGVDPVAASAAFATIQPAVGRGSQQVIALSDGGQFTLIDESYNASPASVDAALAVLCEKEVAGEGRRIAVLGDMLELGVTAPQLHRNIGTALRTLPVDQVYACGPNMAHLFDALDPQQQAQHSEQSEGLVNAITETVRDGDVITVKGSLGSNMKPIVDALIALGPNPNQLAAG